MFQVALPIGLLGVWCSIHPEVSYDVPAECPSLHVWRAKVRAYAIEDPGTHLDAQVRVERAGNELRLFLATDDTVRELRGPECEALLDAAALIVAVALDARGSLEASNGPEPEPDLEPEASSPNEPMLVEPPRVEEAPARDAPVVKPVRDGAGNDPPEAPGQSRPTRTWSPLGRIDVTLGGTLPQRLWGLGGTVGVRGLRRPWRVEASAVHWWGGVVAVDEAQATLSLTAAAVRGCWEPGWRRAEPRHAFTLPVCGGLELGSMRGEGRGDRVVPRAARQLWGALVIGPALAYAPIPWFALVARADLSVPVVRPGFHVDGSTLRYRPAPVAILGTFGIELRLP